MTERLSTALRISLRHGLSHQRNRPRVKASEETNSLPVIGRDIVGAILGLPGDPL